MSEQLTILIVDDHALVRESLGRRLDAEDDLAVIGQAGDAKEALMIARKANPDVVLMDIDMPGMSCFDVVSRLAHERPDMRIILLSAYWNDQYIQQALTAKVSGYLTKLEQPRELIDAIRRVAAGEMCFSEAVRSRIVVGPKGTQLGGRRCTPLATLTPREYEVLCYLAQGLSRREVAEQMYISQKTVAVHTSNVMKKLDIHDRVELARFAIREGIVQP